MNDSQSAPDMEMIAAAKVRRGITHMARRLRGLRSGHGVSGARLSVLGWLFRSAAPMTATDLAQLERLQPQSLTRIIAELDEQGLIRRMQDETDRRQILIEITQAGRDLLVLDAYHQDQWLARAMAAKLTKAEREILCIAAELLESLTGGADPSI